jgi:fructose-bisphosphate aldolase, class I
MDPVSRILSYYEGDNPGTKANLRRFMTAGRLGGTGRMIILPVDQGVEHGPAASFARNPDAYDPEYHFTLAIEGQLSGLAAPLGFLETASDRFAGRIPTILKMNNATSLTSTYDQAFTASVADALRLGCNGVGITIYPGSPRFEEMLEESTETIREAKAVGLPTFMWAYPRGGDLDKKAETALDVVAYAVHVAANLGAHVIKVKAPTSHVALEASRPLYDGWAAGSTLADRLAHVVECAFRGRRIVIFSGGSKRSDDSIFEEAAAIKQAGGNGSIIGRNVFQRPKAEALALLGRIAETYR